jgi:hypothetical protein
MKPIRTIRRLACITAGLAGALLASITAVPAAFGSTSPGPAGPAEPLISTHAVVTGGMPDWQITLIAVGAAVLAAATAVILDRARASRRHVTASAA